MVKIFDCIVVGGGHAGAEAAHAAAKMGAATLLISISRDTIAKMSCNPAIGGLGKGQITREIDALGGIMGKAIDATGIQFRMLNKSKGAAVQSPRAQADKYKYKDFIREVLENTDNLTIEEGMAAEVLTEGGKVVGVKCVDGREFKGKTVIITAGTFLRGLMHIGNERFEGGRLDEPASNELSRSLEHLGIELGRLKTGTPARLDSATVDYEKCEEQPGDEEIVPFSFMTEKIERVQAPCWITWTNEEIHELLRDCIEDGKAPLYSGQIQSTGARYCPSIETKIMRFADKERHQVFLEPEDEANSTIYCNGISTSVPKDVQDKILKLLLGTENAKIVHYAYAIEYDYCPPEQLKVSLESRKVEGLFMAGQVNGTSGYEEAGAQGLIAGINAVRKVQGKEALVLRRDQAYIGVMIDDLMTRGIDEPYRMFTSRAEYRLLLRSDNADRRLTGIGREMGVVDDERWERFSRKVKDIEELSELLKGRRIKGVSLWDMLKRDDSNVFEELEEAEKYCDEVVKAVTIDSRYEGYIARQEKVVEKFKKLENIKIPEGMDYWGISHLRVEAKEKFSQFRPWTLAQAGRISGITPADITVLQINLKKS